MEATVPRCSGSTTSRRAGENHRITAARSAPIGPSQAVGPQSDRVGEDAGGERRDKLNHHARDVECRAHSTERPILDQRLADRHLGDLIDGHGRIGDELLGDQAGERHDR